MSQYTAVSVRGASWFGKQTSIQKKIEAHFNIPKKNLHNENVCRVDISEWEVIEIQNSLIPFLVTTTTKDKWEMCGGCYIVYALTADDAETSIKSITSYEIVKSH